MMRLNIGSASAERTPGVIVGMTAERSIASLTSRAMWWLHFGGPRFMPDRPAATTSPTPTTARLVMPSPCVRFPAATNEDAVRQDMRGRGLRRSSLSGSKQNHAALTFPLLLRRCAVFQSCFQICGSFAMPTRPQAPGARRPFKQEL